MMYDGMARLKLYSYNSRLLDARKEKGLTQAQLALYIGVSTAYLSEIELLKRIPPLPVMSDIADILEKDIDYIFPQELLDACSTGVFNRREVNLSPAQIVSLTEAKQRELLSDGGIEETEESIFKEELEKALIKGMATLNDRQKDVLKLRFGLQGGRERTYEEVGKILGVTRERIRQIESRAFQKLRHRSRSQFLKPFLWPDGKPPKEVNHQRSK